MCYERAKNQWKTNYVKTNMRTMSKIRILRRQPKRNGGRPTRTETGTAHLRGQGVAEIHPPEQPTESHTHHTPRSVQIGDVSPPPVSSVSISNDVSRVVSNVPLKMCWMCWEWRVWRLNFGSDLTRIWLIFFLGQCWRQCEKDPKRIHRNYTRKGSLAVRFKHWRIGVNWIDMNRHEWTHILS